jgi:predicted acyltransferase
MPASKTTRTTARPAARTASRTTTGRTTTGRRRRPAARWDGLDVARGLTVAVAAVLLTGAVLAPTSLGPTPWVGLGPVDLVPGAFLVVAGAGIGWSRDAGVVWTAPRWRRRSLVLVGAGALVVVVRAAVTTGPLPAALAADELLRLLAATAIATGLLRLRAVLLVPLVGLLALLPGALVAGDPLGRGVRTAAPAAAWTLERAVGLPEGGVPFVSLPGAVVLVLAGAAFGVWAHRRPPGPATGAALATVGVWCLAGTVVVGQVLGPTPPVLDLPVALAAVGLGALLLAAGHLVATAGAGEALAALGRTALPVVLVGTLALLATTSPPVLPPAAALTAGGVVAAGAIAIGRRLDATRGRFRA